ncbi:MAG: ABC transporter permease [Verrucomicrobiota bacterium]|nr:ABC transporter permease [Verrucomicrobiota bacterium]
MNPSASLTPDIQEPRALLTLSDIRKSYPSGDSHLEVLHGINLVIHEGEFLAIMGPSGSGKTTLMNLLGLMDTASSGNLLIDGEPVKEMTEDQRAEKRCLLYGFIFQRYNLLNTASALENVEVPAIYAGVPKRQRDMKAMAILSSLGLEKRYSHRPMQMSGGEQQRVAIARALINDAKIILADEPTGALDSHNGSEVMDKLLQLHACGKTIILITHDPDIASNAHRIIRIMDGNIISDELNPHFNGQGRVTPLHELPVNTKNSSSATRIPFSDIIEAAKTGVRSLRANLFRTFLTMLGIIIGVTSVITMLSYGEGAKTELMKIITKMGTNILRVYPGANRGEEAQLNENDVTELKKIDNIEHIVPMLIGNQLIRYQDKIHRTGVSGLTPDFLELEDRVLLRGHFFNDHDYRTSSAVVVLGARASNTLFGEEINPVGKYILINNSPFLVIGVVTVSGGSAAGQDREDDVVLIPLTTARARLFGNISLSQIGIKVNDIKNVNKAQTDIRAGLMKIRQEENFRIFNQALMLDNAIKAQSTFTILLGSIAAISLFVGGIGVMNIMLVNVVERTREIGIRMASGARSKDIQLQFLSESVIVCLIGGIIGVGLGVGASLYGPAMNEAKPVLTLWPIIVAFVCAFSTGVVFGFWPARKASKLDPVIALSSE